jgi:hypothetical protein
MLQEDGSIGDYVWNDMRDNDGIQDAGERKPVVATVIW